MAKVIAVTGATGAQGGGLARAILADKGGEFSLRAITRDPNSDKAKALAAAGAEVVKADLDDPASLERAFQGAHGAYCVTNFWEHFSAEKELEQGRALARAAKAAGVQHAIWSTFEDTRDSIPLTDDRMPTLQGRFKVAHFDAKAEADQTFRELGVPTTFLLTSAYMENLIHFGWGPQKDADGNLFIVFPMGGAPLPIIAVEDIGRCAYGIFRRGAEYVGKTVGIAGDHLTGAQMAAALTKAIGRPVAYRDVPPDVYRGFGFPGAEDIGNMFQSKRDFNALFTGNRNLDESRRLNPGLTSFATWLEKNAARIPVPA